MSLTECQSAKSPLKYPLVKDPIRHSSSHLLVKAVKSCLHVFRVSSTLMSHATGAGDGKGLKGKLLDTRPEPPGPETDMLPHPASGGEIL